MSATPPIVFRFTDGVFVPRSRAQAEKYYVDGEIVALERYEGRSTSTHNHQFAFLDTAWLNLPEAIAADYPTKEHLRKKLLIKAGFCDITQAVFDSNSDAIKAAALVMAADDYCIVTVEGRVLTKATAKSQARNAMKRADFQASKQAILELCASMLSVPPASLER